MKLISIPIAAALALLSSSAFAGAIPYPNVGTENPTTYSFTAATAGDISAYFLGSGAGFDEQLGLLVNGVDTGITGLDDHSTPFGASLDFGTVAANSTLVFYINVNDSGANTVYTYYSDKSLNSDSVNHVYSTPFAGGVLSNGFGTGSFSSGVYVGFEDLSVVNDGFSDYNYTDEQFIFTNTASVASGVPEPTTWAMMLIGFAGLGLVGYYYPARSRVSRVSFA